MRFLIKLQLMIFLIFSLSLAYDSKKLILNQNNGSSALPYNNSILTSIIGQGITGIIQSKFQSRQGFEYIIRRLKENISSVDINHKEIDKNLIIIQTNPCIDDLVLKLIISKSGDCSLALFDINGNCKSIFLNQNLEKGEYQLNLKMTDFANGIYFISLKQFNFITTEKLILNK